MERVVVALTLAIALLSPTTFGQGQSETGQKAQPPENYQGSAAGSQLFAVRGEVSRIAVRGSELIAITVRPSKEFPEVTVIARQNDLVGSGVSRDSGADLLGLFAGGDESRESEKITAAELQQGDVVSVIYDPARGNRALEIYMH